MSFHTRSKDSNGIFIGFNLAQAAVRVAQNTAAKNYTVTFYRPGTTEVFRKYQVEQMNNSDNQLRISDILNSPAKVLADYVYDPNSTLLDSI